MKRKIINFLEDDSNTRLCAGKRDYVTKKGDRRQKRVLLDTLKNLHSIANGVFLESVRLAKNKGLEYKEFDNGIQIVYRKWQPVSTTITDPKTQKARKHERNIVHQHSAYKIKKTKLLKKEAVIHMDFSENYLTKYAEEIQAFHFGGSRQQISLHTVVTYTKEDPSAITHFTWNYHEAGHGKGAPDGVGAVCKRSADRLVGSGNDISSLNDLSEAIQKTCPNINVYLIDDMNILEKEALLATAKEQIKTFPGTLRVHQVSWNIENPNKLKMKSLSCFCNENTCDHFKIGVMIYSSYKKSRLRVEDVYGPDSESEKENSSDSEHVTAPKYGRHQTEDAQQPSTSKNVFKNGDFILVKLLSKKTEYRYVAMCTGLEEDDEIQVVFCKIGDKTGKLFKVDEQDISFITEDQIVQTLPTPNIILKGLRVSTPSKAGQCL
ncbi:hypothetical protein EVAR_82747_1 [Eumeta japonica]|uniref:Uncharacterized protein n=1 Tax=Eumeta variegata TaxID=151549 RepID=A0A4C1UNE7_EUMVA|nr:hypothetical protein EVAR_82747_1 [Eumeta japonica]